MVWVTVVQGFGLKQILFCYSTKVPGTTAAEIAESLERAIDRGEIRPGERLPTVRGFAEQLEVSPVTVAAAYRSLRDRGLIIGEGRRGTRVHAGTGRPYLTVSPVPEGVRNLALGNPDPELVPSLAKALMKLDPQPGLYGGRANLPELLELVRHQLGDEGVATDRVAVVSGGLDGIERVLTSACRAGDAVAVEDPCFPRVLDLIRGLGLRLVPVALDEQGPLPDSLERALRTPVSAALFTPRAQNPTGGFITAGRAGELRRLLGRHPELLVLEDDYAGLLAGAPIKTLTSSRSRWAHVRSVSKVLGPDLRVAFLAGDETTLARVETRQRLGAGWVSQILQRICHELLSDPDTERLLERAAKTYRARRNAMLGALKRRGLRAFGRSGINVWVPVEDEITVVRKLFDAGFAVSAGERFRIASPPGIRITVSTLREGEADEVARCIAPAEQALAWTQAG
jgi:DNA-binding transcriptional MocR family regulator